MNVTLPADAIAPIMSTAILNSLTQDKRDELIKQAIQSLLEVDKSRSYGSYGYNKSPLQMAFESASKRVAETLVEDSMKNDEDFKKKLKALYAEAVEKAFSEDNRNKLVDKIATNISHVISQGD